MKKRILCVFMTIVIMISLSFMSVLAYFREYTQDGARYRIYDGEHLSVWDQEKAGKAYFYNTVSDRYGDVVIPEYVDGCEVVFEPWNGIMAAWKHVTTLSLPEGTETLCNGTFAHMESLQAIYIPASVKEIHPGAFRGGVWDGGYSSVLRLNALTDIFFGGTEQQWKGFIATNGHDFEGTAPNNSTFSEQVTVHFNCSGIGEVGKPAQNYTASFDIWPSEGKSTINKVQGTGTIFHFTVITAPEVRKISLLADKFDGAEWHEITYDFLTDNYFLEPQINSENQKVWTCRFDIHEVGYRTFKLMIDGVNTGIEAHVTVAENSGSFSPTPGQWQGDSDSTPPTIRVLSPIQGIVYREYNDALNFQITAEDASGIEKIDVYKNGYYYDGTEGGYLSFTVPMNYVDDEWNLYQIVATDKSGNQKTQDHYVYIPYWMTMYAPDGRTISILSDEEYDWEQVGWYSYPVMYVYAPDGRNCIINASDVYAWENVGWYRYPVIYMYAPDGRCIVVNASDRAAWESVGWYAY